MSCISSFAAEQRVVRVGAFNFYPGIFKDKDGVIKGFYVDALADLAKRENLRIEYVYGSWNEGLERLKSGEVAVLTSVAWTPERAESMDYASTPLLTVWGELYVPLKSEIDGIRAVHGKKIAVMKGDFNARHFIDLVKKFDIACNFIELPGFEEVFKAVAAKKADAGVVSSVFGVPKQNEYGLRPTGIVFNPFDIFFTVAKGKNHELLALLDSYLTNWRHQKNSAYNTARQKWSHGSNGTMHVIPRWLITSVFALAMATLVTVAFIVLLKRQVRRDTEEIRQREARLRDSELNYRTLANSGQALIWAAGVDKLCNYFNNIWLDFTGRTLEQEFGDGWVESVHPDDYERRLDIYISAFDKCKAFSMDYRLRRHDGEFRWIQDDGCPRYDMNGNFIGYIGYCLDITERKQAEKELQNKNTELERFTYTVSHDLKSPLITIQSYAVMIKQDLQAGNYARAENDLKRIKGAVGRMTALLNDLLELSRIGKQMNAPSRVDMNRLVKNTLALLAGSLGQQNIEVAFSHDLPMINGDHKRIAEVFQNLLENAIKYMGDQAVPRIEIGSRQDGKKCIFFVRDNGKGIDPRYHENIFNLFNQLDTGSEGTGVGLALVKRIIEVHGGRVWVESEGAGHGSRFCFTVG